MAEQSLQSPTGRDGSVLSPVDWIRQNPVAALLMLTAAATFAYFYAYIPLFGNSREQSVFTWIWAVCGKKEYDYEHGRFVPWVIFALLFVARKKIASAPRSSEWWGLVILILGVFFYVASVRTIQARIAAGSIPFIVYGFIVFTWGKHVAKHFLFPLLLVFFAIPLPGLTQATNGLQVIATQIAYHTSSLLGADIVASGNNINSATDSWPGGLNIAEGCSGVRSLIALTFIAAILGYLTQKTLLKKLILLFSSIPLAILANALRVTTIVLIADYWSPEFASKTYHNFSGFIFFPLGLVGLLIVSFLINGGWKKSRSTTRVKKVVRHSNGQDSKLSENQPEPLENSP